MKIELDITSDFADEVACHSLQESYDYLVSSLEVTVPIFSYNQETEKREITKLLKAFEIVMEWYGMELPSAEPTKLEQQLEMEKGKENVNERRVSRRNESPK